MEEASLFFRVLQDENISSKKTYLFSFSLSLSFSALSFSALSFFHRDVGREDDNSDDGDVLIVVVVVVDVEADCSSHHESCFGENHDTVLVEIDGDAQDKITRDFVRTFRVAFAAPAKPRRRSRVFHGFLFFAGIDCQRGSAR